MAIVKYGQTWWGQQWLKSLSNIDYDNRLPRGRTYANNGSVKEVKIEGNIIKAKVKGSRPKPYNVTIQVPPFNALHKERLVKRISENPVLISRLLNRELDQEILSIAQSLGINVFPRQWSDFEMDCSCPDWAVPCKHLAAVIYKVCSEIDNDPFLVFYLHKLDLVEALKDKNISISEHVGTTFLTVPEVLRVNEQLKKEKKEEGLSEEKVERAFQQLNYAAVEDILEPLVRILPDAPPFYLLGNFREVYEKYLKRVAKTVQDIFNGKTDFDYEIGYDSFKRKVSLQEFRVGFEDAISVLYHSDFHTDIRCSGRKITAYELTQTLYQLAPSQLPDYHASVTALHQLQLLSLNLLHKGAVVPQLFINPKKEYLVRWLPALLDQNVRELLKLAEKNLPPNLLLYQNGKEIMDCGDAALQLCSLFLTHFISALSQPDKLDDIVSLFFQAEPQPFSRFGEKAFPAGIAAWLSRFNITHQQWVPLLKIEEAKNEQFAISLEVENQMNAQELPLSLEKVLAQKSFDQIRYPILQSITLLSNFIAGLDFYLKQGAKRPLTLSAREFASFLFDMLPAIRLLNIKTLLPRALQQILRPQATVRLKIRSRDSSAFIRLDDLLSFDWQVAIGREFLEEAEFLKLTRRAHGIVKFRNQYVYLDPKETERLQKALQQPPKMSGIELLCAALSEEYMGAPVEMTGEVQELIKTLTEQKEIPLPSGLLATLRPYQLTGYSWIYRNTRIGFGSLIADDMGLGKTLQVITALLKYKEEGWLHDAPALVVAPTSLLTNWSKELEKFAPSLTYEIYHGGTRSLGNQSFDVLLTSYGLVRSDSAIIKKKKWFVIISDEAQNIKNNEAAQTKAVKSLSAHTFIAMTGTPVENRLSEYWSIMDFANRGLLGNLHYFQNQFARPIQNQHDKTALVQFKKITSPFLLRRLKSDKNIIADLPEKLEQNQYCTLTREQAALYETTLQKALKAIEAVGGEKENMFKRQGLVLQMIMALKQICNHPAQFLKNKKQDASLSGKSQLLLELLETINSSHEKTLIFTQFTEMAEMLQRFIKERFGYEPLYLHGGQTRRLRDEMVQRFQTTTHDRFFILSLKAGGTGLNLTAAQNVIHYDLWWNPAVEAQATDRAYRIGQKKNVMVHRFITQGTFEEKINNMIQSKKELAEMSVGVGENWIGNLNGKELKEMFELD
jgi:uncharacterized Zn finger protein